jgi:serine phosphatase RsbU (regulator of sigma subunit)/pSer/pThr/pTyr-binding forkhead associated (FHA) protein
MAYLRVIAGPNSGQIWEVKKPECILGRHPDCDVSVNAGAASRYHARIVLVENDFYLEDLHSRNGTFLNDDRIQGLRKIGEGDRIRITDTVFAFSHRRPVPPRAKHPLIEGKVKLVMVDDEEQEFRLVPVSKLDVSSNLATAPTHATLQAKLRALVEITQALRKTLALDRVLPQILDSLFVIFPVVERGFIVLEDEQGELEPRWMKLREGDPDRTVQISRTIVRKAMEAQQGILSADAIGDRRFEASNSLPDVRIRSVMCAPLIAGDGKSFGVLQVDTVSERDRFREEDLDVLLSVATQASIAIDNARLHEYTLRKRAMERDLEVADQIQRGFLPKRPPDLPGYAFFSYYEPATHVGGDFYDYVALADGRLAVVVADVVGHGLGAAMLTAKLAAEVRFHLLSSPQPAEAVIRLNASLARDLMEGHFVTLAVAVLTPATGALTIVNAGHLRPILRQPDGQIVDVGQEVSALPLGVVEEIRYEQCAVELSPGGLLLIFTDGLNEAMNEAGELYGLHRICGQLHAEQGGPQQLGQSLVADVKRFVGGRPSQDDMCLICLARE